MSNKFYQVLQLIRGEGAFSGLGKGMVTYPDGEYNEQQIHAACLELERQGLIYRHYISESGSITWMPREQEETS